MLKRFLLTFLISSLAKFAFAMTPFKVNEIKVKGLQRIEIGTVYNYLPIKIGEEINDDIADDIITNLYKTGFFKDIRLERNNNTLVIIVYERPIISEITITGDHEFDHEKLIDALKNNSLSSGKIFDQSILDQALLLLKSEYYNRGLYSVEIKSTVVSLIRNRVSININITENSHAKIASIMFTGNHAFSRFALLGVMELTSGTLLSWWNHNNQYSSDKLSLDLEKIRSLYFDKGYINSKINSVQVQLSSNKRYIYITINIKEGKQYKIGGISIKGELKDVPKNQIESLITVKNGQIANLVEINKNIDDIKRKLGNYAYANATISVIPDIDEINHLVSYTIFIDIGKKLYVRNINISGNDKTRDTIIRRELRQIERSLYNSSKIERSKERLYLLGAFKNVEITQIPVAGVNNQVDLNLKVEEEKTASIRLGLGYTQGTGISVYGALSENNLFGSGKALAFNANTSLLNQNVTLSFTDPYFLLNGTSLGYDLYYNNYTPNKANISPYATQTLGFITKTGIPVSEYDSITFSAEYANNQISLNALNVPYRFIQFKSVYGGNVNEIPVSVSWKRDTTDNALWPTYGGKFEEKFSISIPGIGPQYYQLVSKNAWYLPLTKNLTYKFNATLGIINPYGNTTFTPYYKNFYAGGITTLPGFYMGSLGPRDTDNSFMGGTREILIENDLLFPMPIIKDSRAVRLGIFFDMGSVWGGGNFNLTPAQMFRASVGIGAGWISPLGVIRFSYAKPLFTQPNDILEPFQFTFGTNF